MNAAVDQRHAERYELQGINYELNAVFYSEQIATELEADFERDLAYCSEFSAESYRNRGALPRFRDSVARLLSPLL